MRVCLVLAAVAGITLFHPAVLTAQSAPTLGSVERSIDEGRVDEAREGIGRWWAEAADTASATTRARALYLAALVDDSTDSAVRGYLRLSLEHPSQENAEVALLRLGQAELAAGDEASARGRFERFLRDYPESAIRPQAEYWLARTALRGGDTRTGCRMLGSLAGTSDAGLRSEVREMRSEACEGAAEAEPRPADRPRAERVSPPADGTPRFTVQIGAMRSADAASELRDRARAAGFDAMLVRLGRGEVTRIRVGEFADRDSAADQARRLAERGFDTAVVLIEDG
jgi:cell division septation protein DedD